MKTVYTDRIFPSKKAIKEAIAAGKEVSVYVVDYFGDGSIPDGKHSIVGPEPYKRKFYGTVTVKGGLLTSIK